MPNGYHGKILHVDLSRAHLRSSSPGKRSIGPTWAAARSGCTTCCSQTRAGADPLGPENVLTLMLGVLTGAPDLRAEPHDGQRQIAARRTAIGDSQCGGFFPAEMKFAGFDGMVVKGKAEAGVPVAARRRGRAAPAAHLWGKTTGEAEAMLKEELGDDKIEIAQCGPAGEKLVRFAAIMNMANRANGRTGMGAVMGSKNLKAVAVRGKSSALPLADRQGVIELAKWGAEHFEATRTCNGLRPVRHGRGASTCRTPPAGCPPTTTTAASSSRLRGDLRRR